MRCICRYHFTQYSNCTYKPSERICNFNSLVHVHKFSNATYFFTQNVGNGNLTSYQPLNTWSFHCTVCIHVTSTSIFTEIDHCTPSITGIIFKSRKTTTVTLQNKIQNYFSVQRTVTEGHKL